MKKKIICDNNIWYQIEDEVNPVILNHESEEYYGTAINIIEFISDEKKYKTEKGREIINRAIQSMVKNCEAIILEDPMVYAANKLYDTKSNIDDVEGLNEILDKLIAYSEFRLEKLHGPTIDDLRQFKESFVKGSQNMATRYHELGKKCKNAEKERIDKIQSLSYDWFFKQLNLVKQANLPVLEHSRRKKLNLFISSYSLMLDRLKNSAPKPNSVYDILQLLYFIDEEFDEFWTLDKQIGKRILHLDEMYSTNYIEYLKEKDLYS